MIRLMLILMLVFAASAHAQEPLLEDDQRAISLGGDVTPEAVELVLARQAAGRYEPPEGPRQLHTVPIVFHIVRNSQGYISHVTGRDLDTRIPTAIDDLNRHYTLSGIHFCQAGPPLYIDSDFWAYWQPGATFDELLQIDWVEGAVNIYLFPMPVTIGGVIAFTWTPIQSIGINFTTFNFVDRDNAVTLTQMVSYYFDVFQTDTTMFGVECASGANCATAGDLVCDTPADEGQPVGHDCEWLIPPPYPGPCPGDPTYTPDRDNIMSGGRGRPRCLRHLTPGQQDRAYATLVNIRHEIDLEMCACPADCDLSGTLDINDYFCFVDAFMTEEPYACDMSESAGQRVCDIFDFLAFQDAFVGGCP